jgi:hypothetical protein
MHHISHIPGDGKNQRSLRRAALNPRGRAKSAFLSVIGRWVLVALLGWAVPAMAGDVRIDLSNFISLTPGNWNNVSALNGTTPNLIDFGTGLGTGMSIAGSANWLDFYGDDGGTFPNQSWLTQPATRDGAGLATGLTGSFTLSGLGALSYSIEIVSARTSFGYLNSITINGAQANRTFLGTPVHTPWNSTSDGLGAGNWLIWDNVIPNGGQLTITDVAGPGTLGILNAIRIVSVPEPTSLALTVLGTFAILLRRRRV